MTTNVHQFQFSGITIKSQDYPEQWRAEIENYQANLSAFAISKFGNPDIAEQLAFYHYYNGYVWFQMVAGRPAYFLIGRRFNFLSTGKGDRWEVRMYIITAGQFSGHVIGLDGMNETSNAEEVREWVSSHLPDDAKFG